MTVFMDTLWGLVQTLDDNALRGLTERIREELEERAHPTVEEPTGA